MIKLLSIKIYGKVQGVSFRYYAREQARLLGINGYIRNEKDGSVTIEAEGKENVLEQFLEWCKKGPETAHVEKTEFIFSVDMKNFKEFEVF